MRPIIVIDLPLNTTKKMYILYICIDILRDSMTHAQIIIDPAVNITVIFIHDKICSS